jgi:hypothetical protein
MSMTTIILSTDIERFKQRARKLKKNTQITHTEALDIVAQEAGLNHWHHATLLNKSSMEMETAFRAGCVVAYGVKYGLDIGEGNDILTYHPLMGFIMEKPLFKAWADSPNVDDPLGRTHRGLKTESELEVDFLDNDSYFFYSLRDEFSSKPLVDILDAVAQASFFMPDYLWVKGKMIDIQS